jgi:hypothetical protein
MTNFYLKIDGIEGNVTAKGYEKWFDVFNLKTSPQTHATHVPAASGQHSASHQAAVGEISFEMEITGDYTYCQKIIHSICKSRVHETIEVAYLKMINKQLTCYKKLKLGNVRLVSSATSHLDMGDVSGSTLSVLMSFTHFERTDDRFDAKGVFLSQFVISYDYTSTEAL